MQDFRNLAVWKKAYLLALDVYRETRSFPNSELFGLVSQMRRAVISIGSNISEGSHRGSDREFARFLILARGSAGELEFQLLISRDLSFLGKPQADRLIESVKEVKRMINGLLRKLSAQRHKTIPK